jgi:hypothetical protein
MGRASGRLARHDPLDQLYLRTITMILASVATSSFVILLLFSLPSCLHLRATIFSAEGVGACASSPYSSDISLDTDSRSGYCTSTRTFHIMRAPSFLPSSDVLFVFPAFALIFLRNLLYETLEVGGERWSLIYYLWYPCVNKKYYAKSGDN